MINENLDPFILSYRDSLQRQRDLNRMNAENERRLAQTQIMSSANDSGMMYSNFPERAKIQYDTQTYMPKMIQGEQTYQTGLQKLRQNTLNLANQLKSVNEAIADLNEA